MTQRIKIARKITIFSKRISQPLHVRFSIGQRLHKAWFDEPTPETEELMQDALECFEISHMHLMMQEDMHAAAAAMDSGQYY